MKLNSDLNPNPLPQKGHIDPCLEAGGERKGTEVASIVHNLNPTNQNLQYTTGNRFKFVYKRRAKGEISSRAISPDRNPQLTIQNVVSSHHHPINQKEGLFEQSRSCSNPRSKEAQLGAHLQPTNQNPTHGNKFTTTPSVANNHKLVQGAATRAPVNKLEGNEIFSVPKPNWSSIQEEDTIKVEFRPKVRDLKSLSVGLFRYLNSEIRTQVSIVTVGGKTLAFKNVKSYFHNFY